MKTNSVNNFQRAIDQTNYAKTRTVSAEQGRSAAQNSGVISDKRKNSEASEQTEKFTLSAKLQAQLAAEQQTLKDDVQEAQAGLSHKANESRNKKETGEPDPKIGSGIVGPKTEKRVFELDDESGESYEISETEGSRLDHLDRQSPSRLLDDMPEHTRVAASATLKTHMDTKGVDKVANLKDDPKVTANLERMELTLSDQEWRKNALAPIETGRNAPPLQVDDPHAEESAKIVALKLAEAGGEQMVA